MISVSLKSLEHEIHLFGPPSYGPLDEGRGTWMEVNLGPCAGDARTGTATNANSIPTVMAPLHRTNPDSWVAAHLLNADLGGRGDEERNLVPMTGTANKNHSSLEQRVKKLCIVASQKMRQGSADGYCYYVFYKVHAKHAFNQFDSTYKAVPMYLEVSVEVQEILWTPDGGFSGQGARISRRDKLYSDFATYLFTPTPVYNLSKDLRVAASGANSAAAAAAVGVPPPLKKQHPMQLRNS